MKPTNLICLLATGAALCATMLHAKTSTKAAPGWSLTLQNRNYPFKHAIAYETKIDDENAITVVLSGQAVSNEKLQAAREAEKDGSDGDFGRPFLKLVFTGDGALKYWSAAAGHTTLGRQSGRATGELKRGANAVSGQASQALESDAMFPCSFDVRFDIPLLKAGQSLPESAVPQHGPAANVKPSVSGTFKGNGKEAKLAHVSARWGEPFDGKPGIVLVFTEKDHAKDNKPDLSASFGRFGSALIISLHEDGGIYGCEVVHNAMEKKGFSSLGNLEATDLTCENGKVEGQLTTGGPVDTFGETWEVNLSFVAPLGEIPKEFQPTEAKKEKVIQPDDEATPNDSEDEAGTQPSAAGLRAKDLALTKDATDVNYNTLVEQVSFQSSSDVKKVCAELARNLKAQGWTNDGPDMIQPTSSILKRKRGAAALTIFVKPKNGGSEAKMMTEGLAWDEE